MGKGTIYEHKCLFCEESFTSKRPHSKFCSGNCSKKNSYRERPKFYEGSCSYCDEKFKARKPKPKGTKPRFCSIKCKNHFYKNPDIEKECPVCKKIFVVPFYKRNKSEHCSHSCASIAHWKKVEESGRREEILAKMRDGCLEGRRTGRIKKRFGENAPNWKGGIAKLNHCVRQLERYNEWRKEVFMRDNFTCTHCGDRGYLNADHIKPLCVLLEENNIKNTEQADKCDVLWDINNGRTLCVPCHKKTDTYGGKARIV